MKEIDEYYLYLDTLGNLQLNKHLLPWIIWFSLSMLEFVSMKFTSSEGLLMFWFLSLG